MTEHHNLSKLLYRPTEAAAVLSLGRTRIYELLRSGELKSVQSGRARLIPADALQAFVERLAAASQ